jgi:SHS2 domain-containing protein
MPAQFWFLDDVALADSAFEATGESPSELLLAAANAVIETMVNPDTVNPARSWKVERGEDSLEALLFEWLSHIVYLKDAESILFRDAEAHVTHSSSGWELKGRLRGEPIDASRHELHADVKAVTKHLYNVRHADGRWLARVVLDI